MTGDPEVTGVLCVRNEARRVPRQLAALDAQTGAPPFEVLVVDNGSTDATRRVVAAWREAGGHAATGITLVAGPRRPSIPRTRNLGGDLATGRVLAFCDADDAVHPGWVAALAAAVPDDRLVGGRIRARGAADDPRARLFDGGLVRTPYLPYAVTCNMAVTRAVFEAVGGFDESLPPYGFEDVEFSWRVQRAGFPIAYAPAAVVDYTLSDARASVRKKFRLGRGRVVMARRYPEYDPVRYTLPSTLRDLGRGLVALAVDTVRSRRVDRPLAGHVVAGAGRVLGTLHRDRERHR